MCSVSAPSGSEAPGTFAVELLLPAALAEAADGRRSLRLPLPGGESTFGELLALVRDRHPGLYTRICDETGLVRRYVNLYVDGEDVRTLGGRAAVLQPGAVLLVLQSIAGG